MYLVYVFIWLSQVPAVADKISDLWHVGSSSLTRDQTQPPLHWEHGVLTTERPGKSSKGWILRLWSMQGVGEMWMEGEVIQGERII